LILLIICVSKRVVGNAFVHSAVAFCAIEALVGNDLLHIKALRSLFNWFSKSFTTVVSVGIGVEGLIKVVESVVRSLGEHGWRGE